MSTTEAITSDQREGVLVAAVHRKLFDAEACAALRERVAGPASAGRMPVVLDMAEVSYMSSMAIGALLALMKQLKAADLPLLLAEVGPKLREVLKVTRIESMLPSCGSVEEALSRLRGASPAA